MRSASLNGLNINAILGIGIKSHSANGVKFKSNHKDLISALTDASYHNQI